MDKNPHNLHYNPKGLPQILVIHLIIHEDRMRLLFRWSAINEQMFLTNFFVIFVRMERRYYYQKRDASRTQQETYLSLIIDGMDQAKTSLPHFAGRQSKSISNVDLLKTHVTGVINHGNGCFHSYVDFNQFPHDPNLTINILLRALKKSADKQTHISFLMVGHTHEDVDAQFSLISRTLKTKDCETIESLMTVCNGEHMHTVYDVKNWILPNANKFKLITTPLHYKFQKKDGTINVCYKGLNSQD
ncbi:hypothetical protein MAR_005078 [Mya arenaria]|uniref:DUF7869 domain-containing protein n=1 Tax=Mya arenaria TaxID=6604 RepID=A0ABY7EYF9_MYAAR|nr:hypothetical protein MAR_005078 [Mya arenaria]